MVSEVIEAEYQSRSAYILEKPRKNKSKRFTHTRDPKGYHGWPPTPRVELNQALPFGCSLPLTGVPLTNWEALLRQPKRPGLVEPLFFPPFSRLGRGASHLLTREGWWSSFSLTDFSRSGTLVVLAGTRVWAGGFFQRDLPQGCLKDQTFDKRTCTGGAYRPS